MRKSAKKAFLIYLLVAAIFSLIAVVVPNLLRLESIRNRITDDVSTSLGSQVAIGSLHWRWLPLPHVDVGDIRFDNEQLTLTLPEASLYPDWLALFYQGKGTLRTVNLRHPRIVVKQAAVPTPPTSGANGSPLPPRLKVVVHDGVLTTPALELSQQFRLPAIALSGVDGTVELTRQAVRLDLRGSAPAIKELSVHGRLDQVSKSFRLQVDTQGLTVRRGSVALADGRLIPLDSVLNLKMALNGTGSDRFTGTITGDMPCLLFEPAGRKLPISCGFGDFSVTKEGNRLALSINKLVFREPGLTLHGEVSRTTAVEDGAPRWHINLGGTDLDLSSIRNSLLTLLPDDHIVALVCDIVRGGKANSGSFRFDGPLADLEHIRRMAITADVAQAAIHVPEADLDLVDAAGPIRIQNGELTGSGLRAKLGNSIGTNGNLLVGLAPDHFGFTLGLDIDADLADLLPVLRKEVHHQQFQEELARFSDAQGRAHGHLNLGDTLHVIKVGVTVSDMDGSFRYDRLPWPVTVHGGTLAIDDADRSVRWQGVEATVGPHQIRSSDGSVTWDDAILLNVNKLAATVDGHALYAGLDASPALKDQVAPVLSSIDGKLEIKDGSTLKGPFLEPDQWQYKLLLAGTDLTWRSPLLPGPVTSQSAAAILTDTGLELTDSRNTFLDQSLQVRGDFRHTLYYDWTGTVSFTGTLGQQGADWLKAQGWLPPSALPRTPATLDGLRLTWDHHSLSLDGLIVAGDGGDDHPRARLDVRTTEQNPLAMHIDFMGASEQGHLTLDMLDNIPETFTFRWQGILTKETTTALLAERDLLAGRLAGDFTLTVPVHSDQTRTDGWLEADKLHWYWGLSSEFLNVNAMRLQGQGAQLDVEKLQVDFGNDESLAATGTVMADSKGLRLKGRLTSPSLSMTTVDNFLDDLTELKDLLIDTSGSNDTGWSVTGALDFDLARFKYGEEKNTATGTVQTLVWDPVQGQIILHPDWRTEIAISSAKLCCLDTSGTWFSDPDLGDSHFSVATLCDPLPRFQEVLPCLGISQDVIEGDFTFKADLHGVPKQWHDGVVTIHSDKGRILRMALLAKIFSVVNLTDLFSDNEIPDLEQKGFPYSSLDFNADIKDNKLIIRKAVIHGEGLNLFARGNLDLATMDADITVLIAPLKTLDTIISMVPLIGRVVGGENATVITIPVGVTGPIKDPLVTLLPPSAIGEGILNMVKDTLMLPFNIISPILPGKKKPAE